MSEALLVKKACGEFRPGHKCTRLIVTRKQAAGNECKEDEINQKANWRASEYLYFA